MTSFITIVLALRALRRNLMRSLLTMLGIIIGVAAVIAMVAIGQGAKSQVEAQIASLGRNVIMVMAGNVTRGGFGMGFGSAASLTREDYRAIRAELASVAGISPEVRASAQVAAGRFNASVQILGVGEDYLSIRDWPLDEGVNFTESDIRLSAKVAILGRTTATTLFEGANPVGKTIRIRNAPYLVVGLLSAKGMAMMGNDQDDIVLVPFTSAMVRLTRATAFRSFMIQAASQEQLAETQYEVTSLLRQRHRIQEGGEDDFMVRTQEEIAKMATSTSRIMTALLGAVAGVSLLVGGIGIMNIMLVSVTERTREIGVRMAVGARGRDILMQFLIEAIVLSLNGGVIGILLGIGGARLVAAQLKWTTVVSMNSIIMAFAFSALIGVFFGFYPARKAARLDPIEALRYE